MQTWPHIYQQSKGEAIAILNEKWLDARTIIQTNVFGVKQPSYFKRPCHPTIYNTSRPVNANHFSLVPPADFYSSGEGNMTKRTEG